MYGQCLGAYRRAINSDVSMRSYGESARIDEASNGRNWRHGYCVPCKTGSSSPALSPPSAKRSSWSGNVCAGSMSPRWPVPEDFKRKAIALAEGLQHDDKRAAAKDALRGFIEKILIPPGEELLTVVGKLGAMLDAAAGQKMPGRQAVAIV